MSRRRHRHPRRQHLRRHAMLPYQLLSKLPIGGKLVLGMLPFEATPLSLAITLTVLGHP